MQILYYVWMNCKSYMAPVSGINDQWIWFGYHWIIFLSQAKKSVEEMVCVERCGSGVTLTEFFESQISVMVIIWTQSLAFGCYVGLKFGAWLFELGEIMFWLLSKDWISCISELSWRWYSSNEEPSMAMLYLAVLIGLFWVAINWAGCEVWSSEARGLKASGEV